MVKMVYETFYKKVQKLLNDICVEEKDNIDKAVEVMSRVIAQDGLIYTFGTGHSHMIAEEVFYRAGGIVPIYAIIEDGVTGNHDVTKSEFTERLHGYAKCIIDYHKPTKKDCMIIISESGRNAVPIEMAMECKKRDIPCIAITSIAYSKGQSSRHESGQRLFEVADIIIDNHTLFGDTCMMIEGMTQPVGPTSNIAANFIIHSLVIETIARCYHQNIEVPIFYSGNLDGAREKNNLMLEKYWGRIRTW